MPGDRGRVIVDLFRVVNGLVVEHWDAVQDVPEAMAHGNGMVGDVHPAAADAPSGEAIVRGLLGSAFSDAAPVREGFEAAVGDDYVQHNPEVPDGWEVAIGFFEGLWARFPAFTY